MEAPSTVNSKSGRIKPIGALSYSFGHPERNPESIGAEKASPRESFFPRSSVHMPRRINAGTGSVRQEFSKPRRDQEVFFKMAFESVFEDLHQQPLQIGRAHV